MKFRSMVTVSMILAAVGIPTFAGATFTLVKDGKPACSIVIAEKPSRNATVAAKDLQTYVEKISGAKLEILTDNQVMGDAYVDFILVGRSRLTDAIPGLKIPDGLTPALTEEGYVIHCQNNLLVLAGNDTEVDVSKISQPDPRGHFLGNQIYYGTHYAVCDLLNRFGVRWFLPGEYGEVVPKRSTLKIDDMSVTERPDLVVRYHGSWATDAMLEQRDLWLVRNRMSPRSAEWFGVPADSSIGGYMPKSQLKDHPEWFALQSDGTRSPALPCMTDDLRRDDPATAGQPRIVDEFMKKIGEQADAGQRITSFSPDDGMPTCECDRCRKMSIRYSDGMGVNEKGEPRPEYLTGNEYFFFVNRLLDATAEKYPGHLIATNGYANRYVPPEGIRDFNKHKNLTVMFADILGCTIHAYDDPKCWQNRRQYNLLKRWCQLSDKVWIYGYNYTMLVSKGTITPMVSRIRRNIPMAKEAGCLGFSDLEFVDIGQLGIPTYLLRAALEWDTHADVDAILADFFDKWFGPAAKPMNDFYQTLENAFASSTAHGHEDVILSVIYTPKVMDRLAADIAQAEAAAVAEPVKTRVRMERLIFDHLRLYVDSLRAKEELRFADAARLMRQMLAVKAEMRKINEFFGYVPGPYGMDWEAERMDRLAKKVNGVEGEMLAPLPLMARFRTDRYDAGRFDRWMEPSFDDAKWQLCRVSDGWQNQGLKDEYGLPLTTKDGHAYQGYGWYRFTVETPVVAQGKQARLFMPAVVDQVWVWVNGEYAGRSDYMSCFFRPQEFDIDITSYLRPGKNVIALRVLCNDEYYGANGIYERPFVYVTKP